MVAHMKTTIDIADSLFYEAKRVAARQGMTFRSLVEAALRQRLESESVSKKPFRLRKHTFRGNGLQTGLAEGEWGTIRQRAYDGRGG